LELLEERKEGPAASMRSVDSAPMGRSHAASVYLLTRTPGDVTAGDSLRPPSRLRRFGETTFARH
jgi:hypothetical protein